MPKMKWIGLTGGIASGKSTVARLIESRDYTVIDADRISHDLTRLGQPGYLQILSQFGSEILSHDLQIDRQKLGSQVFSNTEDKLKLEKILHPLIQKKVTEQKDEAQQNNERYCFYDVPLLFEKNLQKQFDFIFTVWCSTEQQLHRLKQRNKLNLEQALSRINSQTTLIDKVSKSNFCIDNSSNESDLIVIVNQFCDRLDLNMI